MSGHPGDIVSTFGELDPRHGATAKIDPELEAKARAFLAKHDALDLADMLFAPINGANHPARAADGHPRYERKTTPAPKPEPTTTEAAKPADLYWSVDDDDPGSYANGWRDALERIGKETA